MTQTTNRFFDELAKLMTDAAGAAHGIRAEVEQVVRSQGERVLRDMDLVQREEFDAVKAMAQKARAENERLLAKIEMLEERLDDLESDQLVAAKPRPVKRRPIRR